MGKVLSFLASGESDVAQRYIEMMLSLGIAQRWWCDLTTREIVAAPREVHGAQGAARSRRETLRPALGVFA
jgi:hypothetical protein